jgi:kinesin family protein 18/19
MSHDKLQKDVTKVLDERVVVILDPRTVVEKTDVLRANRSREKRYAFDRVFDPNSSNLLVYQNTTRYLLAGVLEGYNATVFAYGNTGAGKTHTMIGSVSEPGIMVLTLRDLFKLSERSGKENGTKFRVTVSFIEVYNENIRDLLSTGDDYLDLREDPIKGPVIAGVTEVETNSSNEIMDLLHHGNGNRTQQATAANAGTPSARVALA